MRASVDSSIGKQLDNIGKRSTNDNNLKPQTEENAGNKTGFNYTYIFVVVDKRHANYKKMRWPKGVRRIVLISTCVLFIVCCRYVDGRICGDTDIRNDLKEFETKLRNCTMVAGSLSIALIHKEPNYDFTNISFPELR